MPTPKRLQRLLTRLDKLEAHLLPAVFSLTGRYTARQHDSTTTRRHSSYWCTLNSKAISRTVRENLSQMQKHNISAGAFARRFSRASSSTITPPKTNSD